MDARHVDVLLVGGGVASARCARTLRRNGFTGTIVLVSDEETPPYNRPPLSKELLREDLPTELTLAEPMSWYERRGVELLLSTPVVGLDPDARTATLADGSRLGSASCCWRRGRSRAARRCLARNEFACCGRFRTQSHCGRQRWPGRRRS